MTRGLGSCSSRTSPRCEGEGLTSFSETLPPSGSMRSGQLSPQPPLEHRTDGIAFWPTATSVTYGSSQNGSNSSRLSAGTASLDSMAATWPTPCTTDASSAARHTTTTGVMHTGTTLTDEMRAWCSRRAQTMGTDGLGGPSGAVLSPEFVEALMGLPDSWTHVADDDAYDILVMGLSPGKQQRLF